MMNNRDPNGPVSGRTSRASNMSGVSRMTSKYPGDIGGCGGNTGQDLLSSAGAGIHSMLRTSTELGNVGINGDLSGFGSVARQHQRRGASSRLSTASSVSNQSGYTHRHRHHPSTSSAPRGSMPREPLPLAGVPYIPDALLPTTMNTAGSSPLVPISGRDRDRDSQRSLSMTHSMPPQPPFRQSNNRSMGSLRGGHDPCYRSNSPAVHSVRIGHQSQRAVSPAWGNMPGQNSRRVQTQGGRGQPYPSGVSYPSSNGYSSGGSHPSNSYHTGQYYPGSYPVAQHVPGQLRRRVPSDASLANSETSQGVFRRRGPNRAPFVDDPPPPLPPLQQAYHPWMEQDRRMNNSMIESGSSSFYNMRTDSETPSSDLPLPPTPRNKMPMEIHGGYTHNRIGVDPATHVIREDVSSGPRYYDGSEQFEHEEYTNPRLESMPTDIVKQLKTVAERMPSCLTPPRNWGKKDIPYTTPPRMKVVASGKTSLEAKCAQAANVSELPASPVIVRRITRELVKEGLGPTSTTGDIGSSIESPVAQGIDTAGCPNPNAVTTSLIEDEMSGSSTLPTPTDNRHSVLSQAGSSVLDSETVDLAKSTYIPALTGTIANGLATDVEPASASTGSPERSTEDGMSELLAGYQHTNSKQEGEVSADGEAMFNTAVLAKTCSERKTNHAQTSSDEQSFKSCTDVPGPATPLSPDPGKHQDVEPSKMATSIDSQPPAKDLDSRSFQTCKDASTPGRCSSRAPSRLPSATSANIGPVNETPSSDLPSSSPLRTFIRKGKTLPREASRSLVASKLRRSSKPSMKQGSLSISGSSSILDAAQQPLPVPPRESSTSKEAWRQRGVGSFLMRFKRATKLASEKDTSIRGSIEDLAREPVIQDEERVECGHSVPQPQDVLQTPEKAGIAPELVPKVQKSTQSVDFSSPSGPLRVGRAMLPNLLEMHRRAVSSPAAGYPEPSSVYSPQDISSKVRTYSSPAGIPVSPESSRRDSQSTTHLSWIGHRPFGNPSASANEGHLPLPSVQEDSTTTDLRLSGYIYNYPPQRYLPDLKEESHEDSSLNTSASNLKSSNFRFPHGGGAGLRLSVDDAVFLSRRSSTRSHRRSAIGDRNGLPWLEFSHSNLFEKFKDALGDIRFSRSLDLPDCDKGSPQRSVSAGDLREKTRGSVILVGEVKRMEESTGVIDFAKLKRECPPELMVEIDRLSIPSVTQLTQRFTELLPNLSLEDYCKRHEHGDAGQSVESVESVSIEFPEEQEIMEHALDSIHEVHPPSQKRSSARLRPMRGSSALVVVDDDVFEKLNSMGSGGASSGGQVAGALTSGVGEAATRAKGKSKDVLETPTRQLSPIVELQPPSPAVLRPRSHTAGDQPLRVSIESALSSRRSLRSVITTPTATVTRPWNFDENYPWATTTNPSVDISLPPPTAVKSSSRRGPSHLRNTLSDATTSTFTSAHTHTASPTGNAPSSNPNHQSHRLSLFGCSGDQVHAVGERYPTSALSPPTAIFRDNLSACETSDDEDFTTSRKTRVSLRKRFSSAARNSTILRTPPRVTRSKINAADLASPISAHEDSSSTLQDRASEAQAFTRRNRHTYSDAVGMRISEYHRHRVFASIKNLFHKGADLVRKLSRRHRNHGQ